MRFRRHTGKRFLTLPFRINLKKGCNKKKSIMKKSFVLYKDSFEYLKELSDTDFGILMKFVFEYAISKNEMPKTHSLYLAFAPIKLQLDRDEEKYKTTSETNKINGSKGGKRKVANATKRKRSQTNLADNDNDSDSDSDNENEKGELSTNIFNFKKSLLELCHDENLVNDFMKVRKTKKATNTETAFNSLKREIENSGRGAAECLRVCIERDWKGFKSDWLNKINENGKSTEQSIADWLNM